MARTRSRKRSRKTAHIKRSSHPRKKRRTGRRKKRASRRYQKGGGMPKEMPAAVTLPARALAMGALGFTHLIRAAARSVPRKR